MKALITDEHACSHVDTPRVERLIAFAAQLLDIPEPSEVSVTFIDDQQMAHLNEEHRGKVGPTDVLSFECDNLDDDFPLTGDVFEAGDIIIAPDVAARQALDLGHSFDHEIDTLTVHGLLHLMGYDHIEDKEAAEMQQLQDHILDVWESSESGGSDAR